MTNNTVLVRFGALTLSVLSLLIFHSIDCLAQGGRTGAPLLLIAPDARGRAMAQGGSVYSTGAKSAYYNPANLTSSDIISADIVYINYLPMLADDISIKSFYLSSNFGEWGYWGIAYNRLRLGEQMIYISGSPYSVFTYEDAFTLYSAYNLGPDESIGAGLKYIRSHLTDVGPGKEKGNGTGSSFAIDLGVQLRHGFVNSTLIRDEENSSKSKGGLTLSLSVLNLDPDIEYVDADQSDPLPRRLLVAAGYQPIVTRNYELNLTLDASKLLVDLNDGFSTEWKEIIWSFGIEAKIYKVVALRMGRLNDHAGVQEYWASGLGIGPDWLHADFSYAFESNEEWNRLGGEYAIALAVNLDSLAFRQHGGHEPD